MGDFEVDHIPLPKVDLIPLPGSSDEKSCLKNLKQQSLESSSDLKVKSAVQIPAPVTIETTSESPGSSSPMDTAAIDPAKHKPELFRDGIRMSQNIVDELFKDFLSQKMQEIENDSKSQEVVDSVEEMNKFLDAELSEIGDRQSQKCDRKKSRKDRKTSKDRKKSKDRERKHSREKNNSILDPERVTMDHQTRGEGLNLEDTLKNGKERSCISEETKNIIGEPEEVFPAKVEESRLKDEGEKLIESEGSDDRKEEKKSGPKQLDLKISTFIADLITSGDRIKGTGEKRKTYEEGEISTSNESSGDSGNDTEDDDDDDNINPSETGSLSDSDKEKHSKKKKKKKKKHKHKKKKKAKTKERNESGDKHSNHKRKRSPLRLRSISPKKSRHSHGDSKSRSHSGERHRSSRKYDKHRHEDWEYVGHHKQRSISRSETGNWTRSRSRSRSSERAVKDLRVKINKAKLRQIAIKNALANSMTGQGPAFDLAKVKAGGKSVDELTDLCKTISSKEKGYSDYSTSEEEDYDRKSDDEDKLIHHPFTLNPVKPDIVMNIRNAKQLPTLTPQEKITQSATLRLQFPVSSGSHHRLKESQWVPVDPKTTSVTKTTVTKTTANTTAVTTTTSTTSKSTSKASSTVTAAVAAVDFASAASVPSVALPTAPVKPEDKVFPDPPSEKIDIGEIISARLTAYRKLQNNPHDLDAMRTISAASKKASLWAQSKQLPGQFSGSTGAQIMSHEDLIGPDKRNQAWSAKYSVNKAAPIQGGIGMFLLQKMGWKQGEGLGKNKEGPTAPLLLDFKIDRKGLTSAGEGKKPKQVHNAHAPLPKDLSGKHPVSALTELCNKRRWGPPEFLLIHESGPDHKKNFIFKVVVNKVEYQPSVSSQTKKLAKSAAATACLQTLGLVPKTTPTE